MLGLVLQPLFETQGPHTLRSKVENYMSSVSIIADTAIWVQVTARNTGFDHKHVLLLFLTGGLY